MRKKAFLALYFIHFHWILSQFMDFKFVDPLIDKKLADSSLVLQQFENTVQQQCVIACAANVKCGSVNYHQES